jgi:hypothetical protein
MISRSGAGGIPDRVSFRHPASFKVGMMMEMGREGGEEVSSEFRVSSFEFLCMPLGLAVVYQYIK